MTSPIMNQVTREYGNGHNEARFADKAPSISYTLKTKYIVEDGTGSRRQVT